MNCPVCGHENQEGAKFCSQCGNRLEVLCPVCSATSPADARFCSNCGNSLTGEPAAGSPKDVTPFVPAELLTKIHEARSANTMRGERRTVTMLFADIEGSTAAAEGLDPEDWSDIINGAFEHLIAPVYRYEGTLARLMGDGVLAFFGAPIAHEDDPVRAIRAGLDILEGIKPYSSRIQSQWGIPIHVRVGINTGLVVVGEVGSDLRVEYTALGDAVNVAARMEQTAEPGTIQVTAETWALVEDQFEGEPIGPIDVKGKSEPVRAVRVLGRRGHVVVTATARPLVGRSGELEGLVGLADRLRGRTGWMASVMGEAGVGKSRLVDEFRARTSERIGTAFSHDEAGEIGWMSAFSESYESSVPYSCIRDLLERWWRLEEADDAYASIEELARSTLPDHPDAAAYLAHVASVPPPAGVADFLSGLEPPVLDVRTRDAVISYLEAECARRPTVVALEDIHWADPISLSLIEALMEVAERAPLGLLFSMRPYRDEPPWRIHEVADRDHPHRYRSFELAPLPDQDTEALLDSLLEGLTVPGDLRRRILRRSDGNPLFLEQMAQAMRNGEAGPEGVAVPAGLSSLLTARLDRLDADSKLVAQMASVIGSEFDRRILAALVDGGTDLDRRLTDLLRRGIFVERRGGAGKLGFHHALMQEAAYSTMLLRTRRELHARAAEHLVASDPGAVQEIAMHFLEARETEKAFPHLIAAGEASARSMALSDSIRFFMAALDNIPGGADPDLVVRAHDGLGVAYTLVPDLTNSEATYQRLADYADSCGRPSAKVRALNRLAVTTATLGADLPAANRYLEDAFSLAQEVGDELGMAEYHMNACMIAGLGGDVETAAAHDVETARWGRAMGAEHIRVEGLTRLAENTVWLMDFDRAGPAAEEALEAAREGGDELNLALLESLVISRLRLREGDVAGALERMLHHEGTLLRYASFYAPLAQMLAAHLLLERGEFEPALGRFQAARRSSEAAGTGFFLAVADAGITLANSLLGREEAASAARVAAREAVEGPLGGFVASTVWAHLGHAALALGHLELAAADFDTGLNTSSASRYWEKPRLLAGRALVWSAAGDQEEAHRRLDEAETFLLEKEVRAFDAHVAHARGTVMLAEGRFDEAERRLGEAVDLASAVGLRLVVVDAGRAAARAAMGRGDAAAAREHIASARSAAEQMLDSVEDDDLRRAIDTVWLQPLDELAAGASA